MATVKVCNPFLVGADPEFILLDPPRLVNGQQILRNKEVEGLFGFDHGGYVVEPHPDPNVSTRELCKTIRRSLDYAHFLFPNYRFRAGAHYEAPERAITLGGHVHLDLRDLTPEQLKGMDLFAESLEHLEILPPAECKLRRDHQFGYGKPSDIRKEHGHVEYRSMPSWLYNMKTTMLSMTGIKLIAVAPDTLPAKKFTSVVKLADWLEGFKERDDDVKWMFEKDYFGKSLVADPDASLTKAWRVDATRGKAIADEIAAKKKAAKMAGVHVRAVRARAAQRAVRVQAVHPNFWANLDGAVGNANF